MNVLLSLALMLFVLCAAAPGVSCSRDFVPQKMEEHVKRLKTHFRTSDISLFGNPVFPQDLENFKENEQRLVLQESLDVYVRILSDMLNGTQDGEVKRSIVAIRARMEDLRKSYFHSSEQVLMRRLQELWSLKTDDVTTQRKAVRELLTVFQAASRLGSRIQERTERRRRSRQTPRGGVHQRPRPRP